MFATVVSSCALLFLNVADLELRVNLEETSSEGFAAPGEGSQENSKASSDEDASANVTEEGPDPHEGGHVEAEVALHGEERDQRGAVKDSRRRQGPLEGRRRQAPAPGLATPAPEDGPAVAQD